MDKDNSSLLTFKTLKRHAPLRLDADQGVYVGDDFALQYNTDTLLRSIVDMGYSYRFEDSRLFLITLGHADLTINLIDQHLEAGMLCYLPVGCMVQIGHISDDAQGMGIAFSDDYTAHLSGTHFMQRYGNGIDNFVLRLSEQEMELGMSFFKQMWQCVRLNLFDRDLLRAQLTSVIFLVDLIISRHAQAVTRETPHAEAVFHEFVRLVNVHHRQHRSLSYYAGQLCITDKYLCMITQRVSGFTPKDWIDRATLQTAKMLLKRTDKQVAQISDELNFSHPSSFNKFFRRMTGITPLAYRGRQ